MGSRFLFALLFTLILSCSNGIFKLGDSGGGGGGDQLIIDDSVHAIALAEDGSKSIFIGGEFSEVLGESANRIALIRTDGTVDTGFDMGDGFDDRVNTILISDGSLFVGGDFTDYDGTTRNRLARIQTDGTLLGGFGAGSGADDEVHIITPSDRLSDTLYVAGEFRTLTGTGIIGAARLGTDGGIQSFGGGFVDADFVSVFDMISYSSNGTDDSNLMAGRFDTYIASGSTNLTIARSDGGFQINFSGARPNAAVRAVTTMGGEFYLTGSFTSFNGNGRSIEKFDNAIVFVGAFAPLQFNGQANAAKGDTTIDRVYIGGNFTSYGATSAPGIIRIDTNGTKDTSFNVGTGFNGGVLVIHIDTDNRTIYVGGDFTTYNGSATSHLVHLQTDGSIIQKFP